MKELLESLSDQLAILFTIRRNTKSIPQKDLGIDKDVMMKKKKYSFSKFIKERLLPVLSFCCSALLILLISWLACKLREYSDAKQTKPRDFRDLRSGRAYNANK